MRKGGSLERLRIQLTIFSELGDIEMRKREVSKMIPENLVRIRNSEGDKEFRGKSRGVGVEGGSKRRDNESKLACDDSALKFCGSPS